jgi:nucleotide-binding universal stress UspA family protein
MAPEPPARPSAPPEPAGGPAVLCATDLSPAAHQALALAAELAEAYEARLLVAHALQMWDPRYDFLVEDLQQRLTREARDAVTQELARLGGLEPVPVEVLIHHGPVQEQVLKIVRERQPRLLVIGCNSSKDPRQTYLGGLAEELIRVCPLPVLVARPAPCPDLTHILCAVGGGAHSAEALEWAVDLAEREKAESLTVINAFEVPVGYLEAGFTSASACERMRKIHEEDVRKLLAPHEHRRVRVRVLVEEGAPAQVILRAAKREQPDLLVMGTESRSFLAALLVGNIAGRVVRQAQLPVLLVKSKKHKFSLLAALERL